MFRTQVAKAFTQSAFYAPVMDAMNSGFDMKCSLSFLILVSLNFLAMFLSWIRFMRSAGFASSCIAFAILDHSTSLISNAFVLHTKSAHYITSL